MKILKHEDVYKTSTGGTSEQVIKRCNELVSFVRENIPDFEQADSHLMEVNETEEINFSSQIRSYLKRNAETFGFYLRKVKGHPHVYKSIKWTSDNLSTEGESKEAVKLDKKERKTN